MDVCAQAKEAAKKIQDCQKVLTAIGDETRQHLLIEMMQMGDCHGVRVGGDYQKNQSVPARSIPSPWNSERRRTDRRSQGVHEKLLLF